MSASYSFPCLPPLRHNRGKIKSKIRNVKRGGNEKDPTGIENEQEYDKTIVGWSLSQ